MDIQFYKTFLTVARLGNMTQAAEKLNFSQPTITGQIRALEQHYGVMLFDRVGKKLYITDAGRELTVHAEKLLKVIDEAEKALSAHPGNIILGISTSAFNYILLPFLEEFQKQEQNCSVTLEKCSHTSNVTKGLLENRFDLGLVQNGVPLDCLDGFEILTDQLVWVVHPKLAEKYNYSTDISDYPLLKYNKGGIFITLCESTLGPVKNEPAFVYNDSEAMKNSVLHGLGCGALPLLMIKEHLEDGTLIEFKDIPRPSFSLWVVFHKAKVLSQSAKKLLNILKGK